MLLQQAAVQGSQIRQSFSQQHLKVSAVARAKFDGGVIRINIHAIHFPHCTKPELFPLTLVGVVSGPDACLVAKCCALNAVRYMDQSHGS